MNNQDTKIEETLKQKFSGKNIHHNNVVFVPPK